MRNLIKIAGLGIIFIFGIIFLSFSQTNEEITITTYYPSPSGSYKDLRTQTLKYDPAVLNAANRPVCNTQTEGMTYYDSVDNLIYFCNGTDWLSLAGEATVESGFQIGGFTKDLYTMDSAITSVRMPLSGTGFTLYDYCATSPECQSYNFTPMTSRVTLGRGENIDKIGINYRNFPKGTYNVTWSGQIVVDQYIEIDHIVYISRPAPPDTPENRDAEIKAIYAKIGAKNSAREVKATLRRGDNTLYQIKDKDTNPWEQDLNADNSNQDIDLSTLDDFDITLQDTYRRFSITTDTWYWYRIVLSKQSGTGTSVKLRNVKYHTIDPLTGEETNTEIKCEVYYFIRVKAYFKNIDFKVSRPLG